MFKSSGSVTDDEFFSSIQAGNYMKMSSALCEVTEFGLKVCFLICFVPFSVVLPNIMLNLSQTVHFSKCSDKFQVIQQLQKGTHLLHILYSLQPQPCLLYKEKRTHIYISQHYVNMCRIIYFREVCNLRMVIVILILL